MKYYIKRYAGFLFMLLFILLIIIVNRDFGTRAFRLSFFSVREMALIIPPVFLLLGLLDVWVPRATMVKYMGEDSGFKGMAIAFLIGSAAAGPLYGAFPVASVFIKKGASLKNVFIFMGAWSTTKIPMLLFEFQALGTRFALTRLLVDIPGIIIIAFFLSRMLSDKEKETILAIQPD